MIALPWILVGLGPLIAWGLLFGLRQSWALILKAIKQYLTSPNILQRIFDPFHISDQPRVHQGEKTLGDEALQAEPTTAGFIAGLGGLIEFHAFTVKYIARDTLAALNGLVGHTIPIQVGARTRTAREQAEAASARAKAAAGTAAEAIADINAEVRSGRLTARQAKVLAEKALAKSQAIAIPAPGVIARDRATEKRVAEDSAITRWLRRIAVGVGAGVFAGLIVRALTRELPWFKCSNVNKTMRQLCRTPHNFLNDLLALTADFFVLTNICKVIPWLIAAFDEVALPLVSKLTEVASRICAPPDGAPSSEAAPRLSLPSVTFTQLYLP